MTSVADLVKTLDYEESPHFMRGRDLERAHDFGHVFRKAMRECALRGVYKVQAEPSQDARAVVPVVYVCEAPNEAEARRIHRRVWNQDVVPFLVVLTPQNVRLYSGFRYKRPDPASVGNAFAQGLLAEVLLDEVPERLAGLRGPAIDDGEIWREWGSQITPETRVDWRLLESLQKLGDWLCEGHRGLERDTAHALIGKFVYLRYLRDRNILSDRKLEKWGIDPQDVFSRQAALNTFHRLDKALEEWLNGSIFPIEGPERSSIRAEHLHRLAGTFWGDDPATGQLHLDFEPYDFSYIPIETLSIIYEQFLHAGGKSSKGKSAGAYYTPLAVVNFILAELDRNRPLREGMRVLDPSCGSGAFLVQCYRRLVEQRRHPQNENSIRPVELRALLERHIFGVDRDADACRVAALSLTLALLDYVEPPDLEDNRHRFRLPDLLGTNIFCADFFDPQSRWSETSARVGFDWIVGNPPWTELKGPSVSRENQHLWDWTRQHSREYPVSGNQVAEAFAWKVASHATSDGVIGLLMPAMTLFKDESEKFRAAFFRRMDVWCIANFANLAEVLFRRSRSPAAVMFYRQRAPLQEGAGRRESIVAYSPLVVNQEAGRASKPRKRQEAWHVVVNASEICEVPVQQVASGSMLPWKIAMWGTPLDSRLIQRLERRFPSLEAFAQKHGLSVHQGFELRRGTSTKTAEEPAEFLEDLVGKTTVDFKKLRNCGRIFVFPPEALSELTANNAHLRLRGGRAGLTVSRPPHIVVDASRRFAVYSDEFIAVPARQIGISGRQGQEALLKALSLYLSSDFLTYHQFLVSPEWGVYRTRSTLDALNRLPIPLDQLSSGDIKRLGELHASIVAAQRALEDDVPFTSARATSELDNESCRLLEELNQRVERLLRLRDGESCLIQDLVRLRMPLIQGKTSIDAIRQPDRNDMQAYLQAFKAELDEYVQAGSDMRHEVVAVHDVRSAMICVELKDGTEAGSPMILNADDSGAKRFEAVRRRLRRQHSQWIYFDRGLRIYEGDRTYLFKPMQRILWARSSALADAAELIAETLVQGEIEHVEGR